MTRRDAADRLASYLDEVRGGRSRRECPADHSPANDDARELLEVAAAIAPPPAVEIDPAFRVRARVTLVEAMYAERSAVTRGPLVRFWGAMAGAGAPALAIRRWSHMPALLIGLALALLTASGGAAVASQNAQPGDALYPVKVTVEGLQVTLAAPLRRADRDDDVTATATVAPTNTTAPTNTPVPTETPAPTNTPQPTATTTGATSTPLPTASVPEILTDLKTDVQKLDDDSDVPGRSYEGLLAKLRAAEAAFDRGQRRVAAEILGAFEHELEAMHRSGHISQANYDDLKAKAGALESGLSTTPAPTATAEATNAAQSTPTAEPTHERESHEREDKDNGPPVARPTPRADRDDDHGNGRPADTGRGAQPPANGSGATAPRADDDHGTNRPADTGRGAQPPANGSGATAPRADDDHGTNRPADTGRGAQPPANGSAAGSSGHTDGSAGGNGREGRGKS